MKHGTASAESMDTANEAMSKVRIRFLKGAKIGFRVLLRVSLQGHGLKGLGAKTVLTETF